MTVKIMIKRKVSADKGVKLKDLIMQLRALCLKQPGYVSGESLKSAVRPDEYLVISTWESDNAWKAWLGSKERATIQDQIDTLLGAKTEYEVYEYRP
ncbi:MAG: antibiotic biosynthesis monooxygenase [Deltaproteobacteria bacterium]|nr:antibiotic biosynthesis monooxygenase [Deltaproteobacteria bacterium]